MITFLLDRIVRAMQGGGNPYAVSLMSRAGRRAWYRGRTEIQDSETEFGAGLLYHLQEKRLVPSMRWAATHSPYYRELFAQNHVTPRDIRSIADLRALPFTEREHLAEWRRFLAVPEGEVYRIVTSAGTRGTARTTAFTAADWHRVCSARSVAIGSLLPRSVWHHGRPKALLISQPAIPMWADAESTADALRLLGFDVLTVPDSEPEEAVRWIVDFEPPVIAGTPLSLWSTARCASEVRASFKPSLILGLGEHATPAVRAQTESQWGLAPVEGYGSAEIGGIQTISLPNCRGVHLNGLDFICEVIDPDTGEAAPLGELVITTMLRKAMPLIRYRTGDTVRLVQHNCRVPFPSVEIVGDDDSLLWGGVRISASELVARLQTQIGFAGKLELTAEWVDGRELLTCTVEGDPDERGAAERVRAGIEAAYPGISEDRREESRFEVRVRDQLRSQVKSYRIRDFRSLQ